jgi:hypothetical protein
MSYERHDSKAEAKAYIEDMAQQREDLRAAYAEEARITWAQSHGNDSGFDRYADYE